jgi:hypothetical protein
VVEVRVLRDQILEAPFGEHVEQIDRRAGRLRDVQRDPEQRIDVVSVVRSDRKQEAFDGHRYPTYHPVGT